MALADVARRHGLLVLSDEIYGELDHAGSHVSLARYYPEGTIVTGGLSKWCGAGGWRLGNAVFPRGLRWLLDAVASLASETYSTAAAPIQRAAITAFSGGGDLDQYLTRQRRVLAAVGQAITRALIGGGVDVVAPDGGFYLFPDFGRHRPQLEARGISTGGQLCERRCQVDHRSGRVRDGRPIWCERGGATLVNLFEQGPRPRGGRAEPGDGWRHSRAHRSRE